MDKKVSIKEYLEKIRPDLHGVIDDLKKSDEWKMHATMKPKYMSSTHSNEKCTMYTKSENKRNHPITF